MITMNSARGIIPRSITHSFCPSTLFVPLPLTLVLVVVVVVSKLEERGTRKLALALSHWRNFFNWFGPILDGTFWTGRVQQEKVKRRDGPGAISNLLCWQRVTVD